MNWAFQYTGPIPATMVTDAGCVACERAERATLEKLVARHAGTPTQAERAAYEAHSKTFACDVHSGKHCTLCKRKGAPCDGHWGLERAIQECRATLAAVALPVFEAGVRLIEAKVAEFRPGKWVHARIAYDKDVPEHTPSNVFFELHETDDPRG